MTPKEFHEACHEAILECPQCMGYEDDTWLGDMGFPCEFADLPKKGWNAVISFWKQDDTLWQAGYSECLPEEVLQAFEAIEELHKKAIKAYFAQ